MSRKGLRKVNIKAKDKPKPQELEKYDEERYLESSLEMKGFENDCFTFDMHVEGMIWTEVYISYSYYG